MARSDQPAATVYYGGQAVLEGVMIRGPEHMAIAVRHPKGHIVMHAERLNALYTGDARKVPLLRGVIVLWETLALGMRALAFSSEIAYQEEAKQGEEIEFPKTVFWGTMALALVFVVGVFFAGPILIASLLEIWHVHRAIVVAVEGVIRLGMFIAYIWIIGRIPDIRRVFQYHGAEHMTIHAWEAGKNLTVDEIRAFPKEHTRCGTSFLLVVVTMALVTFFIFDVAVDEGLIVRVASRILLIPIIAGVSYEILRIGARWGGNAFVHAMFLPNLALQGLTTKVPDDAQIEVAIASFEAVLAVTAELGPLEVAPEIGNLEAAPPLD
jgi:uncharacterized protein YqhQ